MDDREKATEQAPRNAAGGRKGAKAPRSARMGQEDDALDLDAFGSAEEDAAPIDEVLDDGVDDGCRSQPRPRYSWATGRTVASSRFTSGGTVAMSSASRAT